VHVGADLVGDEAVEHVDGDVGQPRRRSGRRWPGQRDQRLEADRDDAVGAEVDRRLDRCV